MAARRLADGGRRRVGMLAVALSAVCASPAVADVPDAVRAIDSGDCKGAGEAINAGMDRNDAQAYFLAGYLFDATGCVANDPVRAAGYYQRAVELGNREAADFLGLMHGLGRGVPQDYIAAYRWYTQTPADGAIDSDAARISGYAMTVAHLARSKVRYPLLAERDGLEGTLSAIFEPASGRVAFENVRVGVEVGSNVPKTRPFTESVAVAYAAAVAQAPKPQGLEATPLRFRTPWKFGMRRGRSDEKLQGLGAVSIGTTEATR